MYSICVYVCVFVSLYISVKSGQLSSWSMFTNNHIVSLIVFFAMGHIFSVISIVDGSNDSIWNEIFVPMLLCKQQATYTKVIFSGLQIVD